MIGGIMGSGVGIGMICSLSLRLTRTPVVL